jgi:hypothetical protein
MQKTIMLAVSLFAFTASLVPAASDPPDWASAHGRRDKEHYRHDDDRENYHDRGYVMSREDRVFRGDDGRYHCHRKDGTVGLVVGAALGGLVGNKIGGGGALGTFLGAGAGALLGQEVDRGGVRCE